VRKPDGENPPDHMTISQATVKMKEVTQ